MFGREAVSVEPQLRFPIARNTGIAPTCNPERFRFPGWTLFRVIFFKVKKEKKKNVCAKKACCLLVARTLPILSQILSFQIRCTTFLNFIAFTDFLSWGSKIVKGLVGKQTFSLARLGCVYMRLKRACFQSQNWAIYYIRDQYWSWKQALFKLM